MAAHYKPDTGRRNPIRHAPAQSHPGAGLHKLVGESPALRQLIQEIRDCALSDFGVLITGESGTGKEICAKSLHYQSRRADKPFVPVNCGALPEGILENELFGHSAGAYTSAGSAAKGLIRGAAFGTLFLDEVQMLSHAGQASLLRFLQEKEIRHLGAATHSRVDVRVIAATNIDVEEAVKTGRIRHDLYYRVAVLRLHMPPLRERIADVELLACSFLSKYAANEGKPAARLAPAAIRKLSAYDWPGNVRELENTLQRAIVASRQEVIQPEDIKLERFGPPQGFGRFKEDKAKFVAAWEIARIKALLHASDGNITRAAESADMARSAFRRLMEKYKLNSVGNIPAE